MNMKKKMSITIDLWMEEYLCWICETYEVNCSQALCLLISFAVSSITEDLYPEFKKLSKNKEIVNMAKKINANPESKKKLETIYEFLSLNHFNGRTAWEWRKENKKPLL